MSSGDEKDDHRTSTGCSRRDRSEARLPNGSVMFFLFPGVPPVKRVCSVLKQRLDACALATRLWPKNSRIDSAEKASRSWLF